MRLQSIISALMAQPQLFLAFLEDGYPLADLKDERWKVQEAFLVIEAGFCDSLDSSAALKILRHKDFMI